MKNANIRTLGNVFISALALAGGVGVIGALIAIKNISTVQDAWETYELGRPERARVLGALRKEIGYGGMVHQFKNYVLRQDPARISAIDGKLGGVRAAISRYRVLDLNNAETVALDNIQKVIAEYAGNLLATRNLVSQGRSPRDIDRLVRIEDAPAIKGLEVLEAQARLHAGAGGAVIGKSEIVETLRKSLGYGGMIHQFKNYILRQDQAGTDVIDNHLAAAKAAAALYAEQPLGTAETQAVADISGVIAAYSNALRMAIRLVNQGQLPAQIDRRVAVDDDPALRGLDTLTREIDAQREIEARNVQRSLAVAAWISGAAAWILGVCIIALIAASVWLFRSQIVAPIRKMTDIMSDLAVGNLDRSIEITDTDNEIGEMARAVKVFKANAEALRDSRDKLEQRVLERTKALQHSERRFRDFASTASDWSWEIDPNRRFTFMSETISTIGEGAELYDGASFDEFVGQFHDQSDWDPFYEAFEARQPISGLISRQIEGGQERWIQSNSVPYFAVDGGFLGYRGTSFNITERVRAETVLRESEKNFREILENSPIGIAVVAHVRDNGVTEARRLFANKALVEMFGGKSRREMIHGDISDTWADPDQFYAVNDKLERGIDLVDCEVQRRRLDGAELWISMNTRDIRFDNQDCTMIWHFDITNRRQAEQYSRQLVLAINAIDVGVSLFDANDTLVFCNETFRDTNSDVPEVFAIGTTFEDQLKAILARNLIPDAAGREAEWLRARMERHRKPEGSFELQRQEGTWLLIHEQHLSQGGTITLAVDITEQKAIEAQLRQAQRMEAVGQLTGGVAHDFNNMLAVIIGNLDLIQDAERIKDKSDQEGIAMSLKAALRGAELTDRLLAFSRTQDLNAQVTDINKLVTEFRRLAARTIGADIAIDTKLESSLWPTMVDAGQLENALLNLTINARDAMPNGGQLTMQTANWTQVDDGGAVSEGLAPGDYVVIAVGDNGAGMPAQVIERVFEPFYTTKDVGAGSDLGLSMVFGFAKQSGGQITIDSEEGVGTTVRIYLPRAE
ncbi:MAG: PAS domain S-box protein [Rhodospirillaceae bacterium]|jgi:PAS domain S-box-containing protein|nr:PAS domain S-box protein [Rhodospirillaceae bacterium]